MDREEEAMGQRWSVQEVVASLRQQGAFHRGSFLALRMAPGRGQICCSEDGELAQYHVR